MSHLARIQNQLFRSARLSFQSVFSQRRLNYSRNPDNEIVKSKKSTYLFVAFFGVVSASFAYYVKKQRDFAMMKERERALRKIGMGGKWELTDSNGKLRSTEDFQGKWCMIYFGFTHCPDICPDEMEKMAKVAHGLEKENIELQPIFITIDPDRDTQEVVGKYVKEFSEKIIGLTGTMDEIKKVGQAFNVYFKAGPKDTSDDYIVDHTIILYLIDPTGLFVDYYGTRSAPDDIIASVKFNMDQWKKLQDGKKNLVARLMS